MSHRMFLARVHCRIIVIQVIYRCIAYSKLLRRTNMHYYRIYYYTTIRYTCIFYIKTSVYAPEEIESFYARRTMVALVQESLMEYSTRRSP